MTEPETMPTPRSDVRRRRRILYAAAALALLIVVAFAARSVFSGGEDDTPAKPARLTAPVIVERFELKPVGGGSARGIAELLRRGTATGLRVLARGLTASKDGQVYQLVLAGGGAPEKLLGNEVVGKTGLFVGEAQITVDQLHQHRRIELRLVGQGDPPTEELVLRGAIPD
jgi:hypothetical protein